jgi:IS605 OrfB family transposase
VLRLPLLCGRSVPPPAAHRASDKRRGLILAWSPLPPGRMAARSLTHASSAWPSCTCSGRSDGFPAARTAANAAARPSYCSLLAKAQQHTRTQRHDFHHQEACKLLRAYDVISHDELLVRNMVQNHSLAKSIADAGWSAFIALLTFTAESAGKRVQAVNPAYTSQACSGCGVLVSKGLSVRWHEGPDGGTSLHRDHNAALNILRLGQEQRRPGYGLQALTQPVGAYVA